MHLHPTHAAHPTSAARCRGVVMVITLLGVVLLAAIVFYVFNVGDHVAKRVETQNAADNAAISGARWMARSFNTVAMNNVEMARMIALANVLDAVPQTVDYTLQDQLAFIAAIDRQSAAGTGADSAWVDGGLREARETFLRHVELLRPMHELFNESGYDVAAMTHYQDGSGNRGDLWEAVESLAALNDATMQNLALLTQYSGHRGAVISQREANLGDAGGLVLPWAADVPWEVGAFDDFENPVTRGLLPDELDDKVTNRGPFDSVFGFWQIRSVATTRPVEVNVEQDFGLQSWAPQPPTEEVVGRTPQSYSTWGAYDDMRANAMSIGVSAGGIFSRYQEALADPLDAERHPLVPSLWARRLMFIADRKINGAFPGAETNRVVREPEWVTDYDGAVAIQDAGEPTIAYGMYLLLTYTRDETEGVIPGEPLLDTWGLVRPTSNVLNPPGLAKVADHIWRDDRVERIGPATQRRFIRYYVFLGVNVGPEAEVRNPNNFTTLQRGEMPGPTSFPDEGFDDSEAIRRDRLTLLGVAHQPRRASFWPEGFDADRPDAYHVGVAQAEVFNNHSWDLWTQMWHAQLTPVTELGGWLDTLEDPEDLDQMRWMDEDELAEVTTYLRAVQPLMELMADE
ncbi:MAG: Tad domain-containing protein [Planctomycetota bacterium]